MNISQVKLSSAHLQVYSYMFCMHPQYKYVANYKLYYNLKSKVLTSPCMHKIGLLGPSLSVYTILLTRLLMTISYSSYSYMLHVITV